MLDAAVAFHEPSRRTPATMAFIATQSASAAKAEPDDDHVE